MTSPSKVNPSMLDKEQLIAVVDVQSKLTAAWWTAMSVLIDDVNNGGREEDICRAVEKFRQGFLAAHDLGQGELTNIFKQNAGKAN